jgi:hypothetical protein
MKNTKIMLAVLATLLITWLAIGTLGWLLFNLSFKNCLTNGGTLFLMLFIGWIPSLVVGIDLNDL